MNIRKLKVKVKIAPKEEQEEKSIENVFDLDTFTDFLLLSIGSSIINSDALSVINNTLIRYDLKYNSPKFKNSYIIIDVEQLYKDYVERVRKQDYSEICSASMACVDLYKELERAYLEACEAFESDIPRKSGGLYFVR